MYEVDTVELRKSMIDAGFLSIDALCEECGVNRNTLGSVISGKSYPSANTMARIASACKMSGASAWNIFFKKKLT